MKCVHLRRRRTLKDIRQEKVLPLQEKETNILMYSGGRDMYTDVAVDLLTEQDKT